MEVHRTTLLLVLSLCLLFLSLPFLALADDAAVMKQLAAGLTTKPKNWSNTDFCQWTGIACDSSNRVTSIKLDPQSLTGTLPSTLNTLDLLQTLYLPQNQLSGTIPSLANLGALKDVYLDGNSFTQIELDFQGLASLQTLSFSDNPFQPWTIPSDLAQLSSLVTFSASNVSFFGSIPDVFDNFPSLENLRLSYNNLTGPLPASFAGSNIRNLWLNNQQSGLSGTIDVLVKMVSLSQAWLQKNDFTGPIPEIPNPTSLFDLQLRDNQFTGLVPSSLISIANISLQNNMLQGPLPPFGAGVNATRVANNNFCNDDPTSPCDAQVTTLLEVAGALGYPLTLAEAWKGNDACNQWQFISCDPKGKNITLINLGKRGFSGNISPLFANLASLTELYLNGNNLTGPIPGSLTSLSNLQKLDVSNNNLSGEIPSFPSTVKFITTGNPLLRTSPPSGSGGTPPPGSDAATPGWGVPGTSKNPSTSAGIIAAVVIAIVVFIGVVVFVSYKCCTKKKHQKFGRVQNPENGNGKGKINNAIMGGGMNGYGGVPSELCSQSSGDHNDIQVFEGGNVVISIQVLLQVTSNFSEDNILGRGGFGVVYKGELQDGTKIAVKRMESTAMGNKGMNEFKAEIAVLTKVRHRHLVALLGYCINGNERLLVYEYMPQGTLAEHLFEWGELGYPSLTWKQRVSIALDVARGVEYLHSLARESFIHRDLKPSNILLGDDMRAKVSDFGLVKMAPQGKFSMETRLAGTFGYLAPEYAATGRVTAKVDVYAFGVVLMELLTGRKALDETLSDERSNLVTWFRRVLINKDNIPKAIDQTLKPDDEAYESICKVAELAGHCTAREPFQRPDMGHAVNVLGPLVEQWKPSCHDQEEENSGMNLREALERWQANEGTSTMASGFYRSETQSSIPSGPTGFSNTFDSTDCR